MTMAANPPGPHAMNIALVRGVFDHGAMLRRLVDVCTDPVGRVNAPAPGGVEPAL